VKSAIIPKFRRLQNLKSFLSKHFKQGLLNL
jgi:hypothetical protein